MAREAEAAAGEREGATMRAIVIAKATEDSEVGEQERMFLPGRADVCDRDRDCPIRW